MFTNIRKGMRKPDIDEKRILNELSLTIQNECQTEPGQTNTIVNYLWQNKVIGIKSNSTYKTTYQSVNRFLGMKAFDMVIVANEGNSKETIKEITAKYLISPTPVYKDLRKK